MEGVTMTPKPQPRKRDEAAAERFAASQRKKHGFIDPEGMDIEAFLAGVKYGRRTAIEAVKKMAVVNDLSGPEQLDGLDAIDAIKKRSRS